MTIEEPIPLLETLLADYADILGDEYLGYRNHVYRMIHFCFALQDCSGEQRDKVIIAAAFHDIGIWIEDTVDYIPPSLPPAMAYLERSGRQAWSVEIGLMITEHHKVRAYTDERYPLVEVFRRGDLVDFSFGLIRFGVARSTVREVRAQFPNAGFHQCLGKRAARWFLRHPLNPAPMMKW